MEAVARPSEGGYHTVADPIEVVRCDVHAARIPTQEDRIAIIPRQLVPVDCDTLRALDVDCS